MIPVVPAQQPLFCGVRSSDSAAADALPFSEPAEPADEPQQPLYLSAREARALAVLSGTSLFAVDEPASAPTGTAAAEQALFAKIGHFLRSF